MLTLQWSYCGVGTRRCTTTILISVQDNDVAGVYFGDQSLEIEKGLEAQYTVSQPLLNSTGTVIVHATGSNSQVTVYPEVLIFDLDNRDIPQEVVVKAAEDFVDEDVELYYIRHAFSSQYDHAYNDGAATMGYGGNVIISVVNDDFAGVTLRKRSAGGVGDILTVRELECEDCIRWC